MLREDKLFFKISILVFKEIVNEILKKRNQEKQELYLVIKPILNKIKFGKLEKQLCL